MRVPGLRRLRPLPCNPYAGRPLSCFDHLSALIPYRPDPHQDLHSYHEFYFPSSTIGQVDALLDWAFARHEPRYGRHRLRPRRRAPLQQSHPLVERVDVSSIISPRARLMRKAVGFMIESLAPSIRCLVFGSAWTMQRDEVGLRQHCLDGWKLPRRHRREQSWLSGSLASFN